MGREARIKESGLASALFTPVQQRVLGLLFGQPDRRFQSAEIIRLAASGTGAVQRQLERLAEAGLVEITWDGRQKYYRARRDSPIFSELHGLAVKTSGIVGPLRTALAPLEDRIVLAFVYGSVAEGRDRADSDVDVLVVSDDVSYPDVYAALEGAEDSLGRRIEPTVVTLGEWNREKERGDSFIVRILASPKLQLIGSIDDLA